MSSHAQTRLARPLSDKTQLPMAQDIADDLSVFQQHFHPFAYVLLPQNWVRSYYAVLKISNAEIVCHEQTVVTRVAGDIQSSSRQNSGGHRLVLKQLHLCVESSSLSLLNPSMWNTEVSMQIINISWALCFTDLLLMFTSGFQIISGWQKWKVAKKFGENNCNRSKTGSPCMFCLNWPLGNW